jgi:hypothetical protein
MVVTTVTAEKTVVGPTPAQATPVPPIDKYLAVPGR